MRKTIIKTTTPTGKFLVIRNNPTNNFPFNFSGDYSIGENDIYDEFNNYEFYQKITDNTLGLNRLNFPELNNTSYLTNTGIIVIFTGEHAIIYDILGDGLDGKYTDIKNSDINNLNNKNDSNPANHHYISVISDANGILIANKQYLFKENETQYFILDMDLDDTYINEIHPEIYSETEDISINYFRFKSRQMFLIKSNLHIIDIKIDGYDETFNFDETYSGIYLIDITKFKYLDNNKYIKFIISVSENNSSGWLEVF